MCRRRATVFVLLLCAIGARADLQAQLRARLYASEFSAPIAFVQDPDDAGVQFVVQQGGRIGIVREGAVLSGDFLDLSSAVLAGGERGLLGLAFAPIAGTGRLFVNFTDRSGDTVVARFRRSSGSALAADPASRFDLRWGGPGGGATIVQPFANHNGGNLAFGPDGYLYIGLGDGGSANDPGHRAQDPGDLLGKMLRVDVNVPDVHSTGYQIPADNPFAGGRGPVAARPEIWSFGLRNPWRYSFDDPSRGGTGALILGHGGQGAVE
jgi:glucose/arabinose dehydrogenase